MGDLSIMFKSQTPAGLATNPQNQLTISKTQNIQEDAANHNPKIKAIALNFTKSFELGVFFHDLSIATATRHPAV